MTDEEFQAHLVEGVEIEGQRVTGRLLSSDMPRFNGTRPDAPFVIRMINGDELSIRFAPDESLEGRMTRLDGAIRKWKALERQS